MMNLKKMTKVLLGCALVGAVFAGCGSGNRAQDLDPNERPKVGTLVHLNASEEKFNDIMKRVDETWTGGFSFEYIYYDKLTDMQMGLESGKIKEMSVYDGVARYLMDRNDKFAIAPHEGLDLSDSFCCAVRAFKKEDQVLKDALNGAIASMKEDGTLERLTKEYITDLKKGEQPPAVPMPVIEGAEPLKIAVTGDLPPLDLVLADGNAAGFNTAVLAEIGKRIGRNIEIVHVETGARASALVSGKVDVVFWVAVPVGGSEIPEDIDKPEGVELTVPYYHDKIVRVEKK